MSFSNKFLVHQTVFKPNIKLFFSKNTFRGVWLIRVTPKFFFYQNPSDPPTIRPRKSERKSWRLTTKVWVGRDANLQCMYFILSKSCTFIYILKMFPLFSLHTLLRTLRFTLFFDDEIILPKQHIFLNSNANFNFHVIMLSSVTF